jgi:hypothetical protein
MGLTTQVVKGRLTNQQQLGFNEEEHEDISQQQ